MRQRESTVALDDVEHAPICPQHRPDASAEWRSEMNKLEDMRPSSARKKLEKIAEKYPDTPAGKEAAELAKRYAE